MHFVEQLLRARARVDDAARARELRHLDRSVPPHVGERKAELGEAGDVVDAGIGEVATGQLARALEQVSCDQRVRDTIPIVGRPPVRMQDRSREQ